MSNPAGQWSRTAEAAITTLRGQNHDINRAKSFLSETNQQTNLSGHLVTSRRHDGHRTMHPFDQPAGLNAMFVCCVEAPQRTVIRVSETCQNPATTRG
jgi:hypothetical protein